MSDFWNWIEKDLAPPGIQAIRRQGLYRIIGRIGGQVSEDAWLVKREFFAYLAKNQKAHGLSLDIPHLPIDDDDSYRKRLSDAGTVLRLTGELGGLKAFLDSYVPGRYRIKDSPKDYFRVGISPIGISPIGRSPAVYVYVDNLTGTERRSIRAFLEWFLGADIEYSVIGVLFTVPTNPLSLSELQDNGGSSWLAYHLLQIANVKVDLLPDDSFAIGSGKGVGRSRIYRGGTDEYVVVRCAREKKEDLKRHLKRLIASSIEVIWEES